MLERLDTDRIFAAARRRGFRAELYAEAAHQHAFEVQALALSAPHGGVHESRIEALRLASTGGASLRLSDGRRVHHLSTNRVTTRALLAVLGATDAAEASDEEASFGDGEPAAPAPELMRALSALARPLGADAGPIRFPRLVFRDSVKRFNVVSPEGGRSEGRETAASIAIEWAVERGGRPIVFRHEWWSDSAAALVRELEASGAIAEKLAASSGRTSPWPAPAGRIPVLWSSRAMARLVLHFLQGFEGDRVLGNRSFLNDLKLPCAIPFSITEMPGTEMAAGACDLEGTSRRSVPIFHEGRPRSLACNNAVAEEMAVESTGHCRRESRHAAPTVGFWNAVVEPAGDRRVKSLLAKLEKGIFVEDIDVRRFHDRTGDIGLRLTDARLVHHGEKGEAIEPVDLDLNLVDLLGRLGGFGGEASRHGLLTEKQAQRFLTGITTPEALSPELDIPGRVPASNYW